MKKKQTSFGKNLVRGLKGFAISVVTSLIMIVAYLLVKFLMSIGLLPFGIVIGILLLVLYFYFWGCLAYKFFKWK